MNAACGVSNLDRFLCRRLLSFYQAHPRLYSCGDDDRPAIKQAIEAWQLIPGTRKQLVSMAASLPTST